jgi:peptidoglycan/xylan/chitin deacetylase (PgdA/CDA1 family)
MQRGPISDSQHFSISAFPKPVVLTFDDGFRDFYTEAFPVLQTHGFTATVFLPTAFIGDDRRQFRPSTLNYQLSTTKDCLTWPEVLELRRHGIHFGSHTVNHPKLVELDWPEIAAELSNSKSEIEQQLGEPATTFCYPYAFPQTDHQFVHRFTDLLSDTGYRSCATTALGRVRPGTDPFRLKRLPANSLDDLALFAAKLDGAYDWLAAPQSAAKALKALVRPQRRFRPSTLNPQPSTL